MPLRDLTINDQLTLPASELTVDFVRSSGPGGQHVNKTSSQAQLRWNVVQSTSVSDQQRARITARLRSRLTTDGDLIVSSGLHRSRDRNLDECLERITRLIAQALTVPKARRPTRPTRASKERRIDAKRRRSQTKRDRRAPE